MSNQPMTRWARLLARIEHTVVVMLVALLAVVVCVALVDLWVLFGIRIGDRLAEVRSSAALQDALQNAFGGVLMVLLGLELIETMKVYFKEHRVRVEVILLVAIIATGRHIIQIDAHDVSASTLVALAALMLALSGSYYLLKRGASVDARRGTDE